MSKFRYYMDKAKGLLKDRKPMSSTRKNLKRAKKSFYQTGAGGESRNLPLNPKTAIGKQQESNRRKKQQMYEADKY